jgi:triosephosphate isomerase (TIM)
MRRPILAANWKMHKTAADAVAFAEAFAPRVADASSVDVVIAPPFTALAALGAALAGTPIALAAQNAHPEEQGAFTGEVSAAMLREAGCRYAIVGHSERRTLFGESSELVARKAEALLRHGIRAIVCVGESLAEREAGRTGDVIDAQLRESLARIPADGTAELVIAYEPIWAIGTGRTATPEAAQEVHARVRERLRERFGAGGESVRIQYGGSVKPDNVCELMAQPDIDGALVGGASLEPESFARIVRFEAR